MDARAPVKPADVQETKPERVPAGYLKRSWWTTAQARILVQVALVIAAVGAWEIAARAKLYDTFFFSSPSLIFAKLGEWVASGSLFTNTYATLSEAFIGFVVAALIGIPVGTVLGRSRFWGNVAQPFIDMGNSTPRFALAPLFILWLGLGFLSKVAVVVSIVFFIMVINTMAGVRSVSPDHIRMLQLMGASRRQVFWMVLVPAVREWILAAVRLSTPYALAGAVIGEMIAATQGLGFLIVQRAGYLDTAGVMAAILVLALLGWGLNVLVDFSVRRLSRSGGLTVEER